MARSVYTIYATFVGAALCVLLLFFVPRSDNATNAQECTDTDIARRIVADSRPEMGELERKFWVTAIFQAADKHKLPGPVVVAKIAQESNFRGHLTSYKGAKGASQLMPMWVKGFDPFEIEPNLDKGAEVLAYELQQVNGDIYRALRRYNGGGPNGEKITETEIYASRVLARVFVAEQKVCKPSVEVTVK